MVSYCLYWGVTLLQIKNDSNKEIGSFLTRIDELFARTAVLIVIPPGESERSASDRMLRFAWIRCWKFSLVFVP